MRKYYVESTDTFISEDETKVLEATMKKIVRDDEITIDGQMRVVIETNEEVFDERIANSNSDILFTKYSVKHGLMTSAEARALRAEVNVSRKEFSDMIGISEMSVMFIEKGSLISDQGNELLRLFKKAWNNAQARA